MRKTISAVVISILFGFFAVSVSSAATAEEFYKKAQKFDNIHAFAATCQSAHETGFWTSVLWKKAMNGAGIKADRNWRNSGRMAVLHRSSESEGGRTVYRESWFRAYKSLDEFINDYHAKITMDYPLAAQHSDNLWGYFSSLKKGRLGSWATSPKYFERLADKAFRLAPGLLGAEWRAEFLRDYKEAKARGLLDPNEIITIERRLIGVGVSPLVEKSEI
jgi:hypothetical protein